MQRASDVLFRAVVIGFGTALFVGFSWLIDSNHQRSLAVALTQAGAAFFWVTVVAATWLFLARRSR